MKKRIIATAIATLIFIMVTAESCDTETATKTKKTTKKAETTTTTERLPYRSAESCQQAIKMDDEILNLVAGALNNIFDTAKVEQATEKIVAMTDRRNSLELDCNIEAISDKRDTADLEPCVDVLDIDDKIFEKTGEAFGNIFDTEKMDALTSHVESVTDERLVKKMICESL